MKNVIAISLLILIGKLSFAQGQKIGLSKEFQEGYELSSIYIDDSFVYLPTEKCKKILKISTKSLSSGKPLTTCGHIDMGPLFAAKKATSVEIEGIAFYNGHLLMADEKKPAIWDYDLSGHQLNEMEIKGFDISQDVGDSGVEGITVDPVNNLCYILKERGPESHSTIHVFKISGLTLDFQYNIPIKHNSANCRYSDIYYDVQSKYLLCLKSCYCGKNCKENAYAIDRFFLKFYKKGEILKSADQSSLAIKGMEKTEIEGMYSTNLEGLCIYKTDAYLVSDNVWGGSETLVDRSCKEQQRKSALLLKIPGYSEKFQPDRSFTYTEDSLTLTILFEHSKLTATQSSFKIDLNKNLSATVADSVTIDIRGALLNESISGNQQELKVDFEVAGKQKNETIKEGSFTCTFRIALKRFAKNPTIIIKSKIAKEKHLILTIDSIEVVKK